MTIDYTEEQLQGLDFMDLLNNYLVDLNYSISTSRFTKQELLLDIEDFVNELSDWIKLNKT